MRGTVNDVMSANTSCLRDHENYPVGPRLRLHRFIRLPSRSGGAVPGIRDKRLALDIRQAIFLIAAGALGGAINAVAGGGSFVAFPALLFTGVPPVPANATNTLALWIGTSASGGAYRNHLKTP